MWYIPPDEVYNFNIHLQTVYVYCWPKWWPMVAIHVYTDTKCIYNKRSWYACTTCCCKMEEHPVMTDVDGRIWSASSRYCGCIILECGTLAGARWVSSLRLRVAWPRTACVRKSFHNAINPLNANGVYIRPIFPWARTAYLYACVTFWPIPREEAKPSSSWG